MAKHKLCYERKNKIGEIISYMFFYNGKDSFTDKPKQYTRTWKVPHGLTARQIELERKKAELEFMQECEKKSNGTSLQDSNITFEEFSKEWFDRILKKNEEGYSYYVRAKNTLPLLNEFFGKYQLKAINARMVQRFYDYLCDRTYTKEIVTVKKSINELIEAQRLNKTQLAKECGIDRLTLRLSTKIGQQVSITTARTVCKYFNVPLVNYFQAERKDIKYSKSTNQAVKTLTKESPLISTHTLCNHRTTEPPKSIMTTYSPDNKLKGATSMSNQNQSAQFNGQENFNRELIKIFTKIINEKLPMFLEYCIQTNRAEPIKDVLYTLSVNVF